MENVDDYEECNWIPPKSNIVERLISLAKLTLGTTCKHMDTESLEMLSMMTVNRNLWPLKVFHEITNNADNNFYK